MIILYAPRSALLGLMSHVGMTHRQSSIGDAFWRVCKVESHIDGDYGYITEAGLNQCWRLAGSLHSGGRYESKSRQDKFQCLRQFKYLDYPMQVVGEFGSLAPENIDPHIAELIRSIRTKSQIKEIA